MKYFPVFVDLRQARVLVVGGGEVALRKVRLLLKTEARIEVIAKELHPDLVDNTQVIWVAKEFSPTLLQGVRLAIAADPSINPQVAAAAHERGILVNVVDEPLHSTFITPAIVDRDPVVVAIGTEGSAPVLSQGLRMRIDALLPRNIGTLAKTAAEMRDDVAKTVAFGKPRRDFWNNHFFGTPVHEGGRLSIIVLPQDLEDLTLKAQRRMMEADVIVSLSSRDGAFLEMARRDAVHVGNADALSVPVSEGQNVVILSDDAASALAKARAQGVEAEVIGNIQSELKAA